MILEGLFNLLFSLLDFIIGFLPFRDFTFDLSALNTFVDMFKSIAYFFPMGTVAAIFGIVLLIMSFRIAVAIIKTIWQILPFV